MIRECDEQNERRLKSNMDYQLKTPLLPIKNEYTVVERVFAIRGVDPKDIPHYEYR